MNLKEKKNFIAFFAVIMFLLAFLSGCETMLLQIEIQMNLHKDYMLLFATITGIFAMGFFFYLFLKTLEEYWKEKWNVKE